MLGKSHLLMGMAAGVVLARLTGHSALIDVAPLAVACGAGALLPDIDEPGSTISRQLPGLGISIGFLVTLAQLGPTLPRGAHWGDRVTTFGLACLLGGLIGLLLPHLITHTLGHRGLVHHPLIALALLAAGGAGLLAGVPLILALALGWAVHLIGDACTPSGLPWRAGRRCWLLPRPVRVRTGSAPESLIVVGWLLGALALTGGVPWHW